MVFLLFEVLVYWESEIESFLCEKDKLVNCLPSASNAIVPMNYSCYRQSGSGRDRSSSNLCHTDRELWG